MTKILNADKNAVNKAKSVRADYLGTLLCEALSGVLIQE